MIDALHALKGKRILVTGATGFTGGALVRTLTAAGIQTRVMVRSQPAPGCFAAEVDIQVGDLTNQADCVKAVANIDVIFNVAAVFRTVNVSEGYMHKVHVDSVEWLMQAAKAVGVQKFVHVSTVGVHGNAPLHADESAPFAPGDDYQRTKLAGELRARELSKELQLDCTVVRPCMIYGVGDDRFLKVIKPIAKGVFVMVGNGQSRVHFVHVQDLVDGMILAATRPEARDQVYILGSDVCWTLNDWANLVASLTQQRIPKLHIPYGLVYWLGWLCEMLYAPLPIDPPLHRRRVAFFKNNRSFSYAKAQRELGYAPSHSTESGMRELIEDYQRRGITG